MSKPAKMRTVIQSYTVSMSSVVAILLAGCNRSVVDQGQVVAIVNNEEITRAELQLEARERGLPIGTDAAVRDALVRELVERKMLVQHARTEKLDRTPEFVLASRRLSEVALAQRLLAGGAGETVSPKDIDRFVAANPQAFDQRALFTVDYRRIAQPVSEQLKARLLGAQTSTAIAALLAGAGLKAESKKEVWDSAALTPVPYSALKATRPGGAFVVPAGDGALVGLLLLTSVQPLAEGQRTAMAQALLQQQSRQDVLRQLLQRIEPQARVVYGPQFAPKSGAAPR